MSNICNSLIKLLGGYTVEEYSVKNKQPAFGYLLQTDTSYPIPDDSLKMSSKDVSKIVSEAFPKATIKIDDSDYWKVDTDKLKTCWYMQEITKPRLNYSKYFDCNGFSSLCYSVCSLVADGKLAVADVNGFTDWCGRDEYHAFNMFINLDGKPVLYEPQTGNWYESDKAEIKWIHF